MYFKSQALPTESELRCALYASVFGLLGFFVAATISNSIAGVTSHSATLFQATWTFLYIWVLGVIPSMAITSAVGIPFYSLLKMFGANSPVIVAISGAPVMWLVALLFPNSGYRPLFICAAAVVSLVFGILLWVNKSQNGIKNT